MFAENLSSRSLGIIALAIGIMGFLLIAFPYYLFPQFYNPKSNPDWGYHAPNTLEAWIVLSMALLLIMFALVVTYFYGLKRLAEGKWVNKTFYSLPSANMFSRHSFLFKIRKSQLISMCDFC
jgi:small-conductance mechanosensitive channel